MHMRLRCKSDVGVTMHVSRQAAVAIQDLVVALIPQT